MLARFFWDQATDTSPAVLTGAEAHHILHVHRMKPGSKVTLFNGQGTEFLAEVLRTGRQDVEFNILSRADIDRELPVPIVLGVALPKADRQRVLTEKCTELGVSRLVPLICEHGVVTVNDSGIEKLKRYVIEAMNSAGGIA